jgi:hypothetical protein
MNVPFDKVIVSSDDNPKFYNFWPIVAKAWKKFFPEIILDLCFVTNQKENFIWLEEFGNVYYYDLIPDIPKGNQGKVCRLYHAGLQNNLVCSIHDIDSIPLQRNYLFDILNIRKKNHMILIGGEYYSGKEYGKAPMVPTTAEGFLFEELLNTKNLNWKEFLLSIKNINEFDDKESILNSDNPILHPNNHFSDESLVRALFSRKKISVQRIRRDTCRSLDPGIDWIDRTYRNFSYDIEKLNNGFYTECNMIRPYDETRMKDIINYLS